jgi:ribonuclease P protein component
VLLEEDVPTTQPSPPENPRLPHADEDCQRAKDPQAAEGEGTAPSDRLGHPIRDARLRFRRDFEQLYRYGTTIRGAFMVLIFIRNERTETRRAFVVGRRIGNAVVRNRCRRLLREAYRGLRSDMALRGLDLVLIARPACRGTVYRQVVDELRQLAQSAGLMRSADQGCGETS